MKGMELTNTPLARMGGIIPALITPYDGDGGIHEELLAALVRHLMAKGVAGFYVGGSTGEGLLQTVEERKRVLEAVLQETEGKVPVIAHVGAMDTATCAELARHAARAGADAVSAVTPFYYRHGPEQIRRHYLEIADAAGIPLIVYHFPGLTGARLPADFVGELAAAHEGIAGLKFTSRDMYEMQQILDVCGENFRVYNGSDECALAGFATGACGAIGSTFNIMPELFVALHRHCTEGNWLEARRLQVEANRLIRELLKYDVIAFEREVLRLQGFNVGPPRRPIQQLTETERREIRAIAEQFPFLGVAGQTWKKGGGGVDGGGSNAGRMV